MKKVFKEKLLC